MIKIFLSITLWMHILYSPTTPSVSDEPCDDLVIETADNNMTISNINAAHSHIDVYKVKGDGGWTNVFTCNDNCGKQALVTVEPKKKYIIHVKMFDANWTKICDKQIEHITTGEPTEKEETPSCDNVTVGVQDGTMTISNVKAPHSHVDIYKVRTDGGWDTVMQCNDNCKETITTPAAAQQKYLIHVKYFSDAWTLICDKEIEYNPQ
jgi:5-formaminoimidazole-4-carboxamide-1-beta-D-ribofuranosyl 5'-monophosphate synthetase